jgi:hypothetical protein
LLILVARQSEFDTWTMANNVMYDGVGSTAYRIGVKAELPGTSLSYTDYANYAAFASAHSELVVDSLNEDPLFVDADAGSFGITQSSPCIDAGYDTSALFAAFNTRYGINITSDPFGTTKPQNSVFDIGTYESLSNIPSASMNIGSLEISSVSIGSTPITEIHFNGFQLWPVSGGCSETAVLTCGLTGDGVGYYVGTGTTHLAGIFTAPSAGTVCKISVRLRRSNTSQTSPVVLQIWSNNSGAPGSQIGSDSTEIAAAEIGTASLAAYDFEFPDLDITLTGSTSYWIALAPVNSTLNAYEWEYKGLGCSPEGVQSSANDGASWSEVTAIRALTHAIFYTA